MGSPEPPRNLITRFERCAQGDAETVTLTRGDCRHLLTAWTACNQVLAFHAPPIKSDDEISRPLLALRHALSAAGEDAQ